MNKIIRYFGVPVVLLLCRLSVPADSPLTSTPFAAAYSDEKIVVSAARAKGEITPELMEYLVRPNNPIDLKMAVVNQLGWETRIKHNSGSFYSYLARKHRYKNEDELTQKATADELLALAYLKAMDDYYDVGPAIKYADLALEKNPQSLTYNLIVGLIRSQKAMDTNWCEVFKITNAVKQNSELTVDIKGEAVRIIYKYTDSYEEFCKTAIFSPQRPGVADRITQQ
jgi:hypothetical protein